ncbi:MAG TPA: hydroxyacid dehydrogenase [Tepidisphaeraceae bacterium]|jgi:phosphoglycerate dehydrogenase-like enzyme|nr:hydroxyacid dehydrogenase [Tepidisphaeraceae bacterium]
MKILFHLPQGTLHRCFQQQDLARLQAQHDVILPAADFGHHRDWAAHARDADAVVTGWGTPHISDEMLAQAPKLRALVHSAGTTKTLLPHEFWSRRIRLATANEALGIGVAETTISLIIAGLKGFFPLREETRAGRWLAKDHAAAGFPIRELYQSTIGLIGASKVGRQVIRLLKNFEVSILLSDPHVTTEEASELGVELVELDELLKRSDVVSLHAPALSSTRHMLSYDQFESMKDKSIFINTARGSIVDEDALVAELKTGRIFAFIDVTNPEPPAADHPFRSLPNCVLFPHVAGAISNGCFRQGRSVVDQLLEFAAGKTMHGEVKEEQFRIMA